MSAGGEFRIRLTAQCKECGGTGVTSVTIEDARSYALALLAACDNLPIVTIGAAGGEG